MAEVRTSSDWKAIFFQAIETSHNAAVITDLEGRITFVNSACERLFGYRREELLGERLSLLYPAEAQGTLRQMFQKAKEAGFGQGELELLGRDGTRLGGQVSMVLLQDRRGGYRGILIINRDISELLALRRELERQREELAIRDGFLRILSQSMDLETSFKEALEQVLRLSEFEIGGIALVDRERGILIPKVQRGLPRAVLEDLKQEPLRLDEGLSGVAMERGEPIVIKDLARHPGVSRQSLRESGLRTLLIIPLLSQERIGGFLYLLSKRPMEVPPERLRLLQAIGDQLGIAAESFQLLQKEQRHLSQLLLVEQIAAKASSILELDRLLDEVAVRIQQAFNYHDVLIFFVDHGRQELVRKAWTRYYHRRGPKEERIPLADRGILSWVVRHGQTALVNDVRRDPRYEAFFPETRSELCVPLRWEGRVIGGINVESTQKDAFDEADAALLEALADQLAVAIANAKLYGELEERVARRTAALRASQERLQALSRVAARIQGVLDEERILALAAEEIQRLGFISSFWSVEEGGRAIIRRYFALTPELLAAMSWALESEPLGFRLSLDRVPHIRRAIERGETIVIDNLKKTLTYELYLKYPEVLEPMEQKIGGVVYIPLFIHGRPAWLMTFAFPQMSEAEVKTAEVFAHHLSIALENARLFHELREAQEGLLQAERLATVGQLAGAIAHQLRNPLGVIRNSIFYLRSKLDGREGRVGEHLKLIEEEIRKMDRRIADLLSLAYHREPRPRRLELKSAVERVLARLELPQGVELAMDFASPLQVEADPGQLEQVFSNVIENGIEALEGEGRLLIRGYEEGDGVVLEFVDDGPGLPEEEEAQVFEPLFTTKAQGTGLGLTICRQIVAAHGGQIDFESAEGEGSLVRIRFPSRRRDG